MKCSHNNCFFKYFRLLILTFVSVSTDFFLLIKDLFYCFFSCLVIFYWMLDIVNFVMLCIGWFLYSYKFLGFVSWDWSGAQSGANYFPLLRHSPSEFSPQCAMNEEAFHSGWQEQALSQAYVDARCCFLFNPFGWFFPKS